MIDYRLQVCRLLVTKPLCDPDSVWLQVESLGCRGRGQGRAGQGRAGQGRAGQSSAGQGSLHGVCNFGSGGSNMKLNMETIMKAIDRWRGEMRTGK